MLYNVRIDWSHSEHEFIAVEANSEEEAEDFLRRNGYSALYVKVVNEIKKVLKASDYEPINEMI